MGPDSPRMHRRYMHGTPQVASGVRAHRRIVIGMRTAVEDEGRLRVDSLGVLSTVSLTSVVTRPSGCRVVVVMRVVFCPLAMTVSTFLDELPPCIAG